MYVGFNADLSEIDLEMLLDEAGIDATDYDYLYKSYKTIVNENINSYILKDYLASDKLEEDWFPDFDAEIFISHSHNDLRTAMLLSIFFKACFDIDCFVDSTVWDSADRLLRKVDNINCVNERDPDTGRIITYNYNERNLSTSCVHMLLNGALQKMINKAECLIFLNTPSSLDVSGVIENKLTSSPWIYSELLFSKLCDKHPSANRSQYRMDGIVTESTKFGFKPETAHLKPLDYNHLKELLKINMENDKFSALDKLYDVTNAFRMTPIW